MRGTLATSAYAVLLRELAQHGRVTYAQLLRRHPQFTRDNFAAAVYKARKLGIVEDRPGRGRPIIAAGCCPMCGRSLRREG